jgi:transcriptional regulator with XRE-family HTH domain
MKEKHTTSISKLFKKTREKMGFSQETMARILGCSRVSLSHYEQGIMVPGGDKLEKIILLANKREPSQAVTPDT